MDWCTAALDPGAWFSTVREGGYRLMTAWVGEGKRKKGVRTPAEGEKRKRRTRLRLHLGWTVASLRRFRAAFIFSEQAVWGAGGWGYAARLFLLFSFPCSADHERDWPPYKVVFFGLATNTLNVRNNNNNIINRFIVKNCCCMQSVSCVIGPTKRCTNIGLCRITFIFLKL